MKQATVSKEYEPTEAFARQLDDSDPLRHLRAKFEIPRQDNGQPAIYLCGNSLGLMPKTARVIVEQELDDWANLAVDAHFKGATPWYSYHETFRDIGARLVGANPGEVVMMNSLTVNLHLLMVSFYRPTKQRFKILMDWPAFPSDIYALKTHLRSRGLDPEEALLIAKPRSGEHVLRTDDIETIIDEQGNEIALILFAGVNYYSGQVMNMKRITELGHNQGCIVGFDLAHAAGNIPMQLHDWDVDFAAWCSYKYLNSGPGAVAGVFVHEKHGKNTSLLRYGGWWGNDPETRFKMHLIDEFVPQQEAAGWQISNPPILSMATLTASLSIFDEVTMSVLRDKSLKLTAYLRWLIERKTSPWFQIITAADDASHGCQLSLFIHDQPRERFKALQDAGVVVDFREPNVIRAAPVPLYNSFHDVWRFADVLCGENETADERR